MKKLFDIRWMPRFKRKICFRSILYQSMLEHWNVQINEGNLALLCVNSKSLPEFSNFNEPLYFIHLPTIVVHVFIVLRAAVNVVVWWSFGNWSRESFKEKQWALPWQFNDKHEAEAEQRFYVILLHCYVTLIEIQGELLSFFFLSFFVHDSLLSNGLIRVEIFGTKVFLFSREKKNLLQMHYTKSRNCH